MGDVQSADELKQGSTTSKIVINPEMWPLQGYQSMENDYLLFIKQELVGLVKVHPMETQLTDDMDVFMSQNLIDVGISQVIFYNFEDVPGQLRFVIPFIALPYNRQ